MSVLYACECGQYYPQQELYCCLGCQRLNCTVCTSEEIATYYCPQCLDISTPSEAANFNHRQVDLLSSRNIFIFIIISHALQWVNYNDFFRFYWVDFLNLMTP